MNQSMMRPRSLPSGRGAAVLRRECAGARRAPILLLALWLTLVLASRSLASISVDPTALDFGSWDVCTNTSENRRQVFIRSDGSDGDLVGSLRQGNASITGPNAADFFVFIETSLPYARFLVFFGPTNTGLRTATLNFSIPGRAQPLTVALSGTGTGTVPSLTFTCPAAPLLLNTDGGACVASGVNPPPPGASSGCLPITVTGLRDDGKQLADPYPLGDTTITWTATDRSGNQSSCPQTITVKDTEKPQFGATPNRTVMTDPGQCSAAVSFSAPATDNCGTPTVICKVGDDPVTSPHPFPVGTTTIDCTATDTVGNTASTSFTVTVTDGENPTITCPPGKIVSADADGCGASVPVDPPTATDTCSSVTTKGSRSDGKPLTDRYPLGTTTLTWTATDAAGNTASGTQGVTVKYNWSGVLRPINPDGSSVFKAGSTVPVKFALIGAGACITTAVARFSYVKVGDGAGAVNEAVTGGPATTGNQFRYDWKSGQYVFNWGTKGLSPGKYQVQIDLGDGVSRTVNLGLK